MDLFSIVSLALACMAFAVGIYLQMPWGWPLNFLIFMSFSGIGSLLALYGVYRMMQESSRGSSVVESLVLSMVRSRGGVSVADVVVEGKINSRDAARSLNRLVQLGILKPSVIQGRTIYALS